MHNKPINNQLSTHDANQYLFELKGNRIVYIQDTIVADFTPVRALDIEDNVHKMLVFSIIPTFNEDGRFYSQAFTNPYEGLEAEQRLISEHETKVRETTEIPSDHILLPKPRNKDPFCFVCRTQYSDYLQHVVTSTHKKNIGKSKYQKYILELSGEHGPGRILKKTGDKRSSQRLKQRKGQ